MFCLFVDEQNYIFYIPNILRLERSPKEQSGQDLCYLPVSICYFQLEALQLAELALSKLEFLEVTKKGLSKLQILLIELEVCACDNLG